MDERDGAGGVSGGVGDAESEGAKGEGVVVIQVAVGSWSGDGEAQCCREVENGVIEPGFFEGVDEDFGIGESGAGFEEACHVVGVGVGEDNLLDDELLGLGGVEEGLGLVAAIDDPAGLVGCWIAVGDDEAVCLEIAEDEGLDMWGGGFCWGWCRHMVYYRVGLALAGLMKPARHVSERSCRWH